MKSISRSIIIASVTLLFVLVFLTLLITDSILATIISGFWSAIATASLGGIALWQNRQFEKLSVKTALDTAILQKEIRDLNKQTTSAIDTLMKIEKAKYYPQIALENNSYVGLSKKTYVEEYRNSKYVVMPIIINIPLNEAVDALEKSEEYLYGKYSSVSFFARNIGEKTIRNFICKELKITNTNLSTQISNGCDIRPGQIVIVSILNFPKYSNNEKIEIEITFKMESLVMDKYKLSLDAHVICNDYFKILYDELSTPELIDESESDSFHD